MPPPLPLPPALSVASSVEGTPWVRPTATPAADTSAISSAARPLADSHPKKAAPHLVPPNRSCWASTASRATPLPARAPLAAVLLRNVVSRAVVVLEDSGVELLAMVVLQRLVPRGGG